MRRQPGRGFVAPRGELVSDGRLPVACYVHKDRPLARAMMPDADAWLAGSRAMVVASAANRLLAVGGLGAPLTVPAVRVTFCVGPTTT
jgi:hypothetical protein